ncbi:ABC transporter ATP-binding protein [Gilvimarinus agarilyticus]|uniref:Lipoprotein-releasing system ATP-binding protein n=1 Tax=Reichenbachiella agariperforans TaxID=156994 RepID=A0A1M6W965_REIAG|nr:MULTISPECIES: ABC transporter ATP-binding protein [Reichenbachiella]MBU2888049.1 ABC transporter ATP-binding protein [Gilvimarinus agarilyticus]MBU2915145.1 ABC transporter ATP-binding protein [Reichenbachiella agariperforans]RJE70346.1 lipoprotein ABC transporter ATP-binding protein [Reichenbachiella sp. MSK19-1]SHK90188.1 lipoprotein-releasing system ATP-binding protein [Reichenbachiella agariperforans]
MLHAKNIHKSYGDLEVLKGIDLQVNTSEIISIVGASGAGKSTLLQILGTLDVPDQGVVEINGKNVVGLKPKDLASFRNTQIGFVFQFHNLLPEFTLLENICMPAYIQGRRNQELDEYAAYLMNLLGIQGRKSHKPAQVSGGELQRAAVARALINKPSLIFADEPSGNLDSKNAEELHGLFFKLQKEFGQAFVIVTHNKSLAEMADRKITIQDGSILG